MAKHPSIIMSFTTVFIASAALIGITCLANCPCSLQLPRVISLTNKSFRPFQRGKTREDEEEHTHETILRRQQEHLRLPTPFHGCEWQRRNYRHDGRLEVRRGVESDKRMGLERSQLKGCPGWCLRRWRETRSEERVRRMVVVLLHYILLLRSL